LRRRLKRVSVPLPLALLISVGVVLTVGWATLQPPWQGADEISHFGYVQRLVETRSIPWYAGGKPPGEPLGSSGEAGAATVISGARAMEVNAAMKDRSRRVDEDAWRAMKATLPADAAAAERFTTPMLNPPAYPLYEALPYAALSGADIFTRAYALRLWNIPLVIAVIVSAWVFSGLLVGPRRILQTLATAVVALNAQLIATSATVNADALLAALYSVAFVLLALLLLRGPTRGRVLGLALVTVAAAFTHGRGLPLLLPTVATGAVLLWRWRAPHGRSTRILAGVGTAAAGVAGLLFMVWTATARTLDVTRVREFGSYLWQFYLPKLPFMSSDFSGYGARQVFVDRFWATSPQLDSSLAPRVADVIAIFAIAGVAFFVAVLVARRRTTARAAALGAVLLLAFAGYLLVLHATGFRSITSPAKDPVITGRYLTPFVVLLGAMVAVSVSWLPRRALAVAAAALVFLFLSLQLASLGAEIVRLHA
jgi:hypothetical protein